MIDLIFLDSSFFKALIDPKDDFHRQAKIIWENIFTSNLKLLTTNYILDETFTLLRVKCGLKIVKKLCEVLDQFAEKIKVVRVLPTDDTNAWEWFWNDWSKLSFTDCTSFAVMKRLSLTKVATFDQHFASAGFTIEK